MAIRAGTRTATSTGASGGIVVDGLDAVVTEFTWRATTITPEAGKVTVDHAGKAAQLMRDKVPIDSGDTLDSITSDSAPTMSVGGVYADAGPEHFVARFLENGTVKMSPRPFVGPAADQILGPFTDALGDLAGD